MKKLYAFHLVWAGSQFWMLTNSCTKLDTRVYDQVTNFWQNEAKIAAGVAPSYAGLRNFAGANDVYSLNELSSDEIIVPTRGADWEDNFMWREMWKHEWTPSHALIQGSWQFVY